MFVLSAKFLLSQAYNLMTDIQERKESMSDKGYAIVTKPSSIYLHFGIAQGTKYMVSMFNI